MVLGYVGVNPHQEAPRVYQLQVPPPLRRKLGAPAQGSVPRPHVQSASCPGGVQPPRGL